MGSRSRRPWSTLCTAVVLSASAAACSNPAAPSLSISSPRTIPAQDSGAQKHWPVQHPDGLFGHEDPAYPPAPWQCPRGYDVIYNGWNFICDDPADYDRESPRLEGYPDDWSPGGGL